MDLIEEHTIGLKKTKLGWIPDSWHVDVLGNHLNIQSGDSPSKFDLKPEGKYPYLKVEDLNNCYKYQSESRFYIEENTSLIEKGSVIFPKRGAAILNNKIRKTLVPSQMDTNMMSIKSNSVNLDDEYLYYFILSEKLLKIADTSTIPQINNKHILPYKIALPPLKEQKIIACILSDWDEAIEKSQTHIEKLELRKKGLMHQLLTGKTRLARFNDKWKKVSISEFSKQLTDKNKKDDEIEVLSCTKYDGLVRSLDYFGRKVFGDDLSKYKIVPRGYFAYATNHIEEGSIGYQDLMDRGLVSPMYTVFKTDDTINDSFMFRLLKTDRMIYNYQSNMSGSIARRGGLRWNVFETIIVKIPSKEEQNYIAEFFDKIDEEITQTENYLEQLQSQKEGLMQRLLTGKTRVKV
jgi:type I restriction enzyme S subunit